MRTWDLVLPVERGDDSALFLQIARAIADHIRQGRLRPGDPIPGTRSLARSLGVHRNTVLAACHELAAEGWITTTHGRGTFVSTALPDPAPRAFAPTAPKTGDGTTVRYTMPAAPSRGALSAQVPPGVLTLVGGKPDIRLVPSLSLARAYRR